MTFPHSSNARTRRILSGHLVTEIIHESYGTLNDPNLATHQWCAARPTYVGGVPALGIGPATYQDPGSGIRGARHFWPPVFPSVRNSIHFLLGPTISWYMYMPTSASRDKYRENSQGTGKEDDLRSKP